LTSTYPMRRRISPKRPARWHPRRKVWYVVDRDDLTPFAKWLPLPPRINHRADSYSLLESRRNCWKCRRDTRVFGFAMPHGHEQLEESCPDRDFSSDAEYEAWLEGPDAMQWVAQVAAVLSYVTHISESALARMHSLTLQYRKGRSGVTGTRYFMNHCEHCDAKLGDFETIEEFDAPLRPIGTESASRLLRHPVNERVEADASSASPTEDELGTSKDR
jgi:Domain of unknown function (DUF5710)